jgi:uncharacterized protein
MKLVIWAGLMVIVFVWLKRAMRSRRGDSSKSAAGAGAEAMVRCQHCGTHLPQSDALFNPAGNPFCSEEHRLQHAAR